jgi:hypothetical protein
MIHLATTLSYVSSRRMSWKTLRRMVMKSNESVRDALSLVIGFNAGPDFSFHGVSANCELSLR